MITGLRFVSNGDQLILNSDSVQTGIVKLSTEQSLRISQTQTTVISLSQQITKRVPSDSQADAVYTINQIPASYWNGDYLILGGTCTSVTDRTDTTDIQTETTESHALSIFDGCFSCNSCQTIAQLQEDIQNLQIWINGFKDCNLYYQPAASRLWNAMLSKKISQEDTCILDTTSLGNREQDFGQAVKLLYQFKALAAMWNYLIRTRSVIAQLLQAPQDYGGFVVQSKLDVNACQNPQQQVSSTKLTIDIQLQSGQTGEYLELINSGMGLFITKVDQNTYIALGKDSFEHLNLQAASGGTIQFTKEISSRDGKPHIHAQFTFTPSVSCDAVLAGALKILPVIYTKGKTYETGGQQTTAPSDSLAQLELSQWIAFRPYATTISEAQQTAFNRWYIQVSWDNEALDQHIQQDYYYTAAFNKRPQLSDSLSQPIEFDPQGWFWYTPNWNWYHSDTLDGTIGWGNP